MPPDGVTAGAAAVQSRHAGDHRFGSMWLRDGSASAMREDAAAITRMATAGDGEALHSAAQMRSTCSLSHLITTTAVEVMGAGAEAAPAVEDSLTATPALSLAVVVALRCELARETPGEAARADFVSCVTAAIAAVLPLPLDLEGDLDGPWTPSSCKDACGSINCSH